jgi:hypothetical protein
MLAREHGRPLEAHLGNIVQATTGDVLGRDQAGRIVLAVVVDGWLFDELAAFGTELEDLEPKADEDDDLAEDEER